MRTETRKNLIAAACYSGVFILGMIVGPKFAKENRRPDNNSPASFSSNESGEKMDRILRIIQDKYVDDVKLDTLQSLTIRDILKKLDPHSTYLPPEDAQSLGEDLEGNFNGIGIGYYLLDDTLLVTSVRSGGPSAHSGLERGDRILAVDNKPIAGTGISQKEIAGLIRGMNGTDIDLLVKHPGQPAPAKIRVTRGKVLVSSIDAAYLAEPGTGYIKITRFGARTNEDFTNALQRLQKSGMKNLVLDLRGNGGGYLSAATALADQFLGDKKLIVYTEGLHEPRTDYHATGEGSFEQGGLAILIDENTASASEIVAGAVQDFDRGVIVGRRSFGKGLVQEQFPFGDGSALNLTIARYYTPSGRSIQRSYKNGADAYYEEPGSRFRHGAAPESADLYTDSLYDHDRQFKTSSGRKVYGGGGIRPDIFVPADTTGYTDLYYQLSSKGILNQFVYSRLLQSEKPSSFSSFLKAYQVTEKTYQDLMSFASAKGVAVTENNRPGKQVISNSLKAILALYYFGDDGYYRVLNDRDKAIGRSLEVLRERKLVLAR